MESKGIFRPALLLPRVVTGTVIDLGILLITLAMILSVSELIVRYEFRDVTTTAYGSSYFEERWKRTKVRFNSWHFREHEFHLEKPPGVYRIAIVGDSFTFGSGVDEEDRFSNLIRQKLIDHDQMYEVLNFGRPGADTVDEQVILSDVVLPARPDFVLLQWYVNDAEGADKSGRPRPWPLLPSRALVSRLRGTSALFYLLNRQWMALQEEVGWSRSYEAYMLERIGDPQSPSSIAAEDALKQFIAICRQHTTPVGMVLFGPSYGQRSALDFLVDRVLTLCQRESISCVDTRSTFAPYKDIRQLWANTLDSHPGPLAHRLVADRLMEVFGSKVWVPASDRGGS